MADSDVDGYLPCSIRLLFPNGDVMSKPGRSILRSTPDLPWPGCVTEISGLRNVCKGRLPGELRCRWWIRFHPQLPWNCLGTEDDRIVVEIGEERVPRPAGDGQSSKCPLRFNQSIEFRLQISGQQKKRECKNSHRSVISSQFWYVL